MKKIIFLIAFVFILFPVISFAKVAGDNCTSLDNSKPEGCPSEKVSSPEGLKCNIAANFAGKPINKCVDLRKNIVPDTFDIQEGEKGVYCLTDDNCKASSKGRKVICNQSEWLCTSPVGNRSIHCVRDSECAENYYCNQKDHYCSQRTEQSYGGTCDIKTSTCGKGMECFPISGDKGECRYIRGSRGEEETCSVPSECKKGYYCTPSSGSEMGICTLQLAPTATCSLDEQCSDGYCADSNGVALSEGGKAPGTCLSASKEGEVCDATVGSTKKCASGLICTGVNEQTKEGKCTKSSIETRESIDQKIAREKTQLESDITSQLKRYCDNQATPGLFTKGVSNACFNCGNCGTRDIMVVIANVINELLRIVGLIAVLGSIVSGFMYMLSRGNDEQVGKAKAALTASVVGLIIIFTGYVLINTVMEVLGYNCGLWYAPTFTC